MSIFKQIINRLPVSVIRHIFNFWPPFRGAGIKVDYISKDYRIFKASLQLGLLNRNFFGTHFDGSLFAMSDAFFSIILAKNLGNNYIVWDKAANITYKKPGRGTVRAHFEFSADEIAVIKKETDSAGKYVFDRSVDIIDASNEIVASVVKTLYVRVKDLT